MKRWMKWAFWFGALAVFLYLSFMVYMTFQQLSVMK